MDNNNIMDNNITHNNNTTNIKRSKKIRSFKKKKKAKPILSQHGGAKYDFNDLIGIETKGTMTCWVVSAIQMLWNIDDLRNYLLRTSEADIKELKRMTEAQKEADQTNEKQRISDLVLSKHKYIIPDDNIRGDLIDIVEGLDKKSPLFNEYRDFPYKGTPDTIEDKQNMILALRSIFKAYSSTIENIKTNHSEGNNEVFKMEYGDIKKDELKEKKLIALMDKLSYTTIGGEEKDPIDEIINYCNIKEEVKPGDKPGDKAGDPISLIKLTFLLFEDIQDDKIIELKKWFRVCILYIDETNVRYKINFKNIIDIIPKEECDKTEVCNLQLMINTEYINPSKYKFNMLLFQETKFLLFTINEIALIGKDHSKFNLSIEANKTINIYNRNYKLRGCIIHTGNDRASGHETFLAYNNEGEKAALLNGPYKINLLDVNDEHVAKRELNPNNQGTLYLYELADGDTDLAASLAGSLAVATEIKPASETDSAAALTATLAGTQFDPTDKPGVIKPPLPPVVIKPPPPHDVIKPPPPHDVIKPPQPDVIKPPQPDVIKPPQPGGDDHTIRAGIEQQDGSKDIKPYNASLDIPSGESNGENMVLGILLVITLAITGVLFVQR